MNQNILKGLLIILVIIDHNEYAHSLFPGFLAGFSFHVVGFFALPFLRPANLPGKAVFEKMFFSYYYPFLWMVCAMVLLTIIINKNFHSSSFEQICLALYSGNSYILKSVAQMSLLWFLPSFFSLMLIRSLMAEQSIFVKNIFFLFLVVAHFWIGAIESEIRNYLPLGLLPTLYAIPIILAIVTLHQSVFEKMPRTSSALITTGAFLFVKYWQIKMGLSQELGFAEVADYRNMTAMLVNDLEAITGVLMLFQLARFELGYLIEKCGKNSLQVYLLHAFVALVIYKVLEKYLHDTAMMSKFVISIGITILTTGLLAKLMMNNRIIKRLLFPKSWQDLCKMQKSSPQP